MKRKGDGVGFTAEIWMGAGNWGADGSCWDSKEEMWGSELPDGGGRNEDR